MNTILLHTTFALVVLSTACGSEDPAPDEANQIEDRACELFETTAADVASTSNEIDAPDITQGLHLSVAIPEIGTTGTGLGHLAHSVATAGQYHFFVDTLLAGVVVAAEDANPGVFLDATGGTGRIPDCLVTSSKVFDLEAGQYGLTVTGPAGVVGLVMLRAE